MLKFKDSKFFSLLLDFLCYCLKYANKILDYSIFAFAASLGFFSGLFGVLDSVGIIDWLLSK